jgi:hypothetical protein
MVKPQTPKGALLWEPGFWGFKDEPGLGGVLTCGSIVGKEH